MTKAKKRIIYIGVPVLVLVVATIVFSMNGKKEEKISVKTAKVERQKIIETVNATGRIQPKTQVKISADVAAKITRLEVKEGDWVKQGQFLVQLDRERYLALLESAQANTRSIEANANLVKENMLKTEKDYLRTQELFDKGLESQALLDQFYAAYKVEKARYQSALEQVEQARASQKQVLDDLSKTTIYAPMAGTVSKLNKEVGEIALGSQFQEDVIMVISNLSGMEALVDVDENDIVSVHLGDSARIEVDALPDLVLSGRVTEIANSAKVSATGTTDQKTEFEVKIAVDSPGSQLRPGMTSSADIITETREQALVVPIQSVAVRSLEQLNSKTESADSLDKPNYTADKDGFVQLVFTVRDDMAHAVQVGTGIQSDTHIEVLSGLEEGDQVVTGNYRAISEQLFHEAPVVISNNTSEAIAGR